jgi:cytochrome c553/enamine deaminase RidA (YjgF/YER057c/UK114 family)
MPERRGPARLLRERPGARRVTTAMGALLAWAGIVLAGPAAAQAESGSAQEFGYCLVCHGSDLGGNMAIAAPNLTQLQPWYIEAQLHAFARGYRANNPVDHAARSMASAVRRVMAEDSLVEAIAFVESYPALFSAPTLAVETSVKQLEGEPPPVIADVAEEGVAVAMPETTAGNVARGETLYGNCAACHGADGAGNEAVRAPSLLGLNDWYQVKQLLDYRAGHRGVHPDDSYGGAMRAAALQLPDEQAVYDVVAYVQTLTDEAAAALQAGDGAASVGAHRPSPLNASLASRDGDSGTTFIPHTEVSTPMANTTRSRGLRGALPAVALAAAATSAPAQDVTRYPLPGGSTFPIAQAVSVPAGTELLFHSGLLPAPADPDAERGTRAYYGDTYAQTMSVLRRFEASLEEKGLDLGSIIKMNVFLVGDPEMDGKMDFAGFMRAYSQFFGTEEQPHLPARAAVQVAGLAGGALVEIEVIAARPPAAP